MEIVVRGIMIWAATALVVFGIALLVDWVRGHVGE